MLLKRNCFQAQLVAFSLRGLLPRRLLGDKMRGSLKVNTQMSDNLKYGIRVTMPDNDPLSAAHLLGESWSSERWFATETERDRMLSAMETQPVYYRKGDQPSIILEKISR